MSGLTQREKIEIVFENFTHEIYLEKNYIDTFKFFFFF